VRQGKALYIGISNWPLEPLRKATQYLKERDVPLLIYQGRLNKIDRQPIDEGILNYCHSEGIGFIAYSPLAQGLLTERYINTLAQTEEQRFQIPSDSRMAKAVFLTPDRLTPEMRQYLLEQKAEADRNGRPMAEMSLRWVLEQQGVTSVLVGASSVEQLKTKLAK
jgi:L-glyceraldehyde 3-phosphate reductase